jgi:hypothetical protein
VGEGIETSLVAWIPLNVWLRLVGILIVALAFVALAFVALAFVGSAFCDSTMSERCWVPANAESITGHHDSRPKGMAPLRRPR